MPIRTRFVRRLAWGLFVTGLMIALVGEILVIDNELLYGGERRAQDRVWLWPAVGIGAAMAALGLLLFVLGPQYARLPRRRILTGLHKRITSDGSRSNDPDFTRPLMEFGGLAVRPDAPHTRPRAFHPWHPGIRPRRRTERAS